MWYPNKSWNSDNLYLDRFGNYTTYTSSQNVSQISEQASTSNYPNYQQNQWSYDNSSHMPVDSRSCQKLPSHYSGLEGSTQNPYIYNDNANLNSSKGEFERECDNFIYQCISQNNKEFRSKSRAGSVSRSNSLRGSPPVHSVKRSRSPSSKRHKSYSQERSPKRVRTYSSISEHHKVKNSKKKKVKERSRSVSASRSRDYHVRRFSWFSSDSDSDSEKYSKIHKSIEKTTLKAIIKEILKVFDRPSDSEEVALKCLRDLHKREFAEYRKYPEFHPLYLLKRRRWNSHMKQKGFDLRHETVEREWNRYFSGVLKKSFDESWHKKEKKLLKILQNKKIKSSVKTDSHSSTIRSDSKQHGSSSARDKGADRRHHPEVRSHRRRSSSPTSREKKYPKDNHRDFSKKKRDRSPEKNLKSSNYSSERKPVRRDREENKDRVRHPVRVKRSPQERRNSEKLHSSHSSNKDQTLSSSGNHKKDSAKQNSSRDKYEDVKNVSKLISDYVKEPLADANKEGQFLESLVPKHSSVKDRLTYVSPAKPSVKDRLYIPWEAKKNRSIESPVINKSQSNIESTEKIIPSSIRIELQTNGNKYGANERVIVLKNSNDDLTESDNNMLLSNKDNNNDNLNGELDNELKTEISNYSPHVNLFSVLKQMKDKFGSFADPISEMYNTMSELNKEGKSLINYIDSDAETLLLLIKDKVNGFISDSKTSLIQKAIYLETLTNLTSFLEEVKERQKALAKEADEKQKALAEETDVKSSVKDIDIESLAKAVAGKDCKEIINFVKEYFQFRKINYEREDIMNIYMDVKKYQSTLTIDKKPEESPSMKNNEEEQHSEKKVHRKVVISSPKSNSSRHSATIRNRSRENLSSVKSRITPPKRVSNTNVGKKTVISKSGKKVGRDNIKTDSNKETSFVKTDSKRKTNLVKSTSSSNPSQSVKTEHTFKMKLKKSGHSSVSNVNILSHKSSVSRTTNYSDTEDEDQSSPGRALTSIYSVGQLVTLSLVNKMDIYKKFSKYSKETQSILNRYLKNIMISNLALGQTLSKCKK